jgi:stearoyl-CoA desaturase (delta-9 desaturase)
VIGPSATNEPAPRTGPRISRSRAERTRGMAWIAVLHAAPLAALAVGVRPADWFAFGGFYLLLALSVGIGLHRYFAHHAFRTSRTFQLVMGLAATLTFTDPIAFAGKHRLHHRYADREGDTHRPADGWWHCWFGSLTDEGYSETEIVRLAQDLTRWPELVWLHRWRYVPPFALAGLVWWLGGFAMLALGYFGALALLLNLTSSVNYLCHRFGRQRYATGDASRNNALVAIWSFGEGWHNNHHHYPGAARAGFFWWEVDALYWLIRLLAWFGIVWDVREVPSKLKHPPPAEQKPPEARHAETVRSLPEIPHRRPVPCRSPRTSRPI